MAICRMCHKTIPDGKSFCEECEQKRVNQADESYLDSLLSLVSEKNTNERLPVRKRSEGLPDLIESTETMSDITQTDDISGVMPDIVMPSNDISSVSEADITSDININAFPEGNIAPDIDITAVPEGDITPDIDITAVPEGDISPIDDITANAGADITPDEITDPAADDIITDSDITVNADADITVGDDITTLEAADITPDGDITAAAEDITADADLTEDPFADISEENTADPGSASDTDIIEETDDIIIPDIIPETDADDQTVDEGSADVGEEPSIDDISELIDISGPDESEAVSDEDTAEASDEAGDISAEADASDIDISNLIDIMDDNTVSPFEASGVTDPGISADDLVTPIEDMISLDGENDESGSQITEQSDITTIINNIESGEFDEEVKKMMPSSEGSEEAKPKKKKSFFEKIFGNVVEERTPEEEKAYQEKLEAEAQKKAEALEAKKQQKQKSKEEKAAEKEQAKAEKAEADKAKAEAKKKAKEEAKEKARQKKEQKLALEAAEPDEGRINRIGASIIFVIFVALTVLILFGSSIYSYNISIRNAQKEFDVRHYNDAYREVYGIDIKDEDIELYDRIMTVMYVNTQLNSYEYYMKSNNTEKALDSLLKGLQRYDRYYQLATKLGITDDLNYVKGNILEQLSEQFSMTEADAYDIIGITDSIDYSDYIYELLGTYDLDE